MLELQVMHNVMQIFCEGVVVVSGRRLTGFAESAPVIGNHAIACVEKNWDLLFPRCTAEGISVNQNDWLPRAMVFVIKMDGSGVLFSNINVRHKVPP